MILCCRQTASFIDHMWPKGSVLLHGVCDEDKVSPHSCFLRRAVEHILCRLAPSSPSLLPRHSFNFTRRQVLEVCLSISQRGLRGHWRLLLESVLISGNIGRKRTLMVTLTLHLTTSSGEFVTVDLLLACTLWKGG